MIFKGREWYCIV